MKKVFSAIIYFFGVIIFVVLLSLYIFRVEGDVNYDAMIPVKTWESASVFLAIGFVPMLLSTIFFIKCFPVKKENKILYILTLLPAIGCGIFFLNFVLFLGYLIIYQYIQIIRGN